MSTPFTRLASFPRHRLIEAELIHGRTGELDLLTRLGAPTTHTSADELQPVFFWDVEWACGLVMDLQFKQLSEELIVRLDQVDPAHALRHLAFEVRDLVLPDVPASVETGVLPVIVDTRWAIWGGAADAGQLFAANLTERDARCWCRELTEDDAGSAPSYWVTTDH